MALLFPPVPQFGDSNLAPAASGSLSVFDNGTTDLATIYTDAALLTTKTNPVVLDAAGRCDNIFVTDGVSYTVTLKDAVDAQLWSRDDIWGIPASLSQASDIVYNVGLTGSAATTVEAKLQELVSVQDFGATGNQVTNDSTAFIAAEAAATLVFLPDATGYKLTSAVPTTDSAWLISPTLSWDQATDDGKLDIARGFYLGSNVWRFADRVFVGEAAAENAGIFSPGGGGHAWISQETVSYTSGGTYEVLAGDVIIGDTSGATGEIVSLTLTSGTWAAGTAAGVFVIRSRTGTFQAETLNVLTTSNVATIAAATAPKYPDYIARAAQLLSSATDGGGVGGVVGVAGIARSSDTTTGSTIGIGAVLVNDKASASGWGFVTEIQKESGAGFTTGIEVAAKNKGADATMTPYARTSGVFGLWMQGGGDTTFGGASANPNDTAIAIVNGSNTWNKGIVFEDDAITGTDGVTGTGMAIEMAKGQTIRWRSAAGIAADIRSDVVTASTNISQIFSDDTVDWRGSSGLRIFQARYVASAVNFIDVLSSVTAAAPVMSAQGTDTNIDLKLSAKGSGVIQFGTYTTLGGESVAGYISIKDAGGTARKIAVVA